MFSVARRRPLRRSRRPSWAWVALVGAIAVLLVGDLLARPPPPARDHRSRRRRSSPASGSRSASAFAVVMLGWSPAAPPPVSTSSGYLIEKSLSIDNVFVWAVIFTLLRRARRSTSSGCCSGASSARSCCGPCSSSPASRCIETLRVGPVRLRRVPARTPRCKIARHDGADGATRASNRRAAARAPGRAVDRRVRRAEAVHPPRTAALLATPLFAVLVLIETTDVVFAVDSIPAILAVSPRAVHRLRRRTRSPSSACGRCTSCSPAWPSRFRYLNVGLGVILAFVGVKMLLVDVVHLPTVVSLGVIVGVLAVTIVLSLRADGRGRACAPMPSSVRPMHPPTRTPPTSKRDRGAGPGARPRWG